MIRTATLTLQKVPCTFFRAVRAMLAVLFFSPPKYVGEISVGLYVRVVDGFVVW
jgi:hypothetical protein